MKTLVIAVIGVSALGLAGCQRPFHMAHHAALRPISRLNCPESEGQFQRKSVSPDGKSCDYTGPDGSQAQLKLASFSGDPDAVLDPVEAQMKTMLPAPSAPPPSSLPASSAWASPSGSGHDDVNINLPGISIHADDKNANVHVGGVHIDADDRTNSVKINGGGSGHGHRGQFTVNADDNGAVIRTRGFGANIEQSLIMASKAPGPQGWRTLAYEAVGPKSGPLVIASYQSRQDNHDSTFEDVKRLAWRAAR